MINSTHAPFYNAQAGLVLFKDAFEIEDSKIAVTAAYNFVITQLALGNVQVALSHVQVRVCVFQAFL